MKIANRKTVEGSGLRRVVPEVPVELWRASVASVGERMGCMVTRYGLVAVPVKPRDSGVRAFCTDQTGQLYMDADWSVEACLLGRALAPKM